MPRELKNNGSSNEHAVSGMPANSEPLIATMENLPWEQEAFERIGVDFAAPIPQHWIQKSVLARMLTHRLKVSFSTHILSRVRKVSDQSSLSAQRQRVNL